MEIEAISSEEPAELPYVEPENLNKVGREALKVFTFIALCAFIPACFKKKRVLSPLFTPIPSLAEPAMEEPAEHLPVPRCEKTYSDQIAELFHTVAEGGANFLNPAKIYRLYKIKANILPVHPFSFLLAAPRERVQQILNSGSDLKISNFIAGVAHGMERELGKNNIHRFIASFAGEMGKRPQDLIPLIQARDWMKLVSHLYDITQS